MDGNQAGDVELNLKASEANKIELTTYEAV